MPQLNYSCCEKKDCSNLLGEKLVLLNTSPAILCTQHRRAFDQDSRTLDLLQKIYVMKAKWMVYNSMLCNAGIPVDPDDVFGEAISHANQEITLLRECDVFIRTWLDESLGK